MKDSGRHVLILAGEPSGDVHGAGLITAMRKQDPSLKFYGIGGTCMAKAGAHLFFPIEELSAMGLLEVIRQIRPVNRRLTFSNIICERWIRNLSYWLITPDSISGPLHMPEPTVRQMYFTIFRPKCGHGIRPALSR